MGNMLINMAGTLFHVLTWRCKGQVKVETKLLRPVRQARQDHEN